jgi:hypothetical protein
MTSVMCLHFNMQEKVNLGYTNDKCHDILMTSFKITCNLRPTQKRSNTIMDTGGKIGTISPLLTCSSNCSHVDGSIIN